MFELKQNIMNSHGALNLFLPKHYKLYLRILPAFLAFSLLLKMLECNLIIAEEMTYLSTKKEGTWSEQKQPLRGMVECTLEELLLVAYIWYMNEEASF